MRSLVARSIKDIVKDLNDQFFLPTIQRDFVWLKNSRENKIEKLLDSLMLHYPIGQIILWKPQSKEGISVYKFLEEYDTRNVLNENNLDVTVAPAPPYLVLDGQQRLTALNLALKSTSKIIDKGGNYKYMHINLFYQPNPDEVNDLSYGFKFLTEEKAKIIDEKNLWFRISKIMDDENDVENFKNDKFSALCDQHRNKIQLLKK